MQPQSKGTGRPGALARSRLHVSAPEGLQRAEDLLGLGDGKPTAQSKLGLGLQRRVERERDLLGSGSL